MKKNEETPKNLSIRRAAIVEAVNKSIEIFAAHEEETFEEVMTNGIRPFADAIGIDRVVLFKLMDIEGSGKKQLEQIYRWDKSKDGLITLDNELSIFSPNFPVLKKWYSIASQGGCIRFKESDCTEDVAAFMSNYGIKSILIVPIFRYGEFWGVINFQDHTNDRYFDEDCSDLLHTAARVFSNAVIRESAIKTLKRREKMEAALNRAAIFFLSHNEKTFEANMTAGVKEIADVCNLDRFSLLRNFSVSDGKRYGGQIYRWDRNSGGTTSPIKELENFSPTQYVPDWEKIFTSGGIINGPVKLLPDAAVLQSFGLVSICVTPVFINNIFWGIAFFEDLHSERYFEEDSVEIMRLGAFLCANTVIRAEMEREIAKADEFLKIRLEQQELISHLSRGFISSGDSQTLVNEAVAKLGRYHNVSLVFVFAVDYEYKDTYLAYHWTADGAPPRNAITNLYKLLTDFFPVTLPDCYTVPIVSCDDTTDDPDPVFRALNAINIMAIIGVPLYVDGRLWGVMSVEQSNTPRKWTENEKEFVAMTASTIAGIIMRDIYTVKLKEALNNAMEASKAKSEFLSNMSHEMRTPLNAITGMTIIGKNAKDMERKNYALDKIEDASTHLLGVINDVLDMSKIETNKLELSPVEFNFEKMLQKTIAAINFRIDEKFQKLVVQIDERIPQTLIADDQRLAQVINNLLSNAVKFSHENGSIILKVDLIKEENGICTIQVSVSDKGIGISKEQQTRIFYPFQQAESSATRKYGGTGLGLAISKSIVEMMNGSIWVQSELDKGSTFFFTVQVKRGAQDSQKRLRSKPLFLNADAEEINEQLNTDKRQIEEKQADDITGVFAGRHALLVEDAEINREIVQVLFEPTELEIECAENGAEAVSMFAEAPYRYDIIFMDIQMPKMSGYEATRRIRDIEEEINKSKDAGNNGNLHRKIPIIAMTANVFEEDIEKCLAAGMDCHVGKPIDFDEVMNKLHSYLRWKKDEC